MMVIAVFVFGLLAKILGFCWIDFVAFRFRQFGGLDNGPLTYEAPSRFLRASRINFALRLCDLPLDFRGFHNCFFGFPFSFSQIYNQCIRIELDFV